MFIVGWILIVLGILLLVLGIIEAAKSVFKGKALADDTSWWEDLLAVLKAVVSTSGGVFLLFGLVLLVLGLNLAGYSPWPLNLSNQAS